MIYLATTRFNNSTFQEFKNFYKEKNIKNVIYNVPVPIKSKFDKDAHFIVIEMNNSTNTIEGISLIDNLVYYNKYKIYNDDNYNRYCYEGKYKIERDQFNEKEKELINHLENICFKGKRHLKRGQGIQVISNKVIDYYLRENEHLQFLIPLQQMFLEHFRKNN